MNPLCFLKALFVNLNMILLISCILLLQASRMTTYLHAATNSLQGTFPAGEEKICVLPCTVICGSYKRCASADRPAPHSKMARYNTLQKVHVHCTVDMVEYYPLKKPLTITFLSKYEIILLDPFLCNFVRPKTSDKLSVNIELVCACRKSEKVI